jgi:hypothetical protein
MATIKIDSYQNESQEVRSVYFIIGEEEYRVCVNKFNELEINKSYSDTGAMQIIPHASNEIRIK